MESSGKVLIYIPSGEFAVILDDGIGTCSLPDRVYPMTCTMEGLEDYWTDHSIDYIDTTLLKLVTIEFKIVI